MHSVSVNLEAAQYLAGWRPEAGSLFLPALSESRVGDPVAVRVGIYGQTIRATLFGKVALVRRIGRPALPPGVELNLDRGSVAAAGFLAMAARGEPVSFRERAPRYAAERRLVVEHAGTSFESATLNVSEGGCSLRWAGQLPLVGDLLGLKLGTGIFAPVARAVVCWNQPGGAVERSAGVRIISDGRAGRAWRSLVADVARSGARAA
ncbi:PilZ domain-containing protein [Anaeromyxobacter oryzae]|uniref:PilZ domain-containing protein n=1 Tax=Anaeromyxobacter oryzae TaxID=2918170 RepID=UPI0020BE1EF2|nr:PilZ domain-containing protein [Anaeromyxobacter oryzae]